MHCTYGTRGLAGARPLARCASSASRPRKGNRASGATTVKPVYVLPQSDTSKILGKVSMLVHDASGQPSADSVASRLSSDPGFHLVAAAANGNEAIINVPTNGKFWDPG